MSKQFSSVEAALAFLRDSKAIAASNIPEDLKAPYERLTTAIADWIDASRIHETGSYARACYTLEALVHSLPIPPRDDSFEKIVENLTGERKSEVEKDDEDDAEMEIMTVDLNDVESHKDLPPYVQKLVRDMRKALGKEKEED